MASEFFEDRERVKGLFREIADLKTQKREIEDYLKVKEQIAFSFMDHTGSQTIDTDFGKFSRVTIKVWEYSPQVDAAKQQVDSLKKSEIDQGIAKVKAETSQLRFTATKD